jgi:hypothetical protein
MTAQTNHLEIAWWAKNIDELDREIARLCLICQVRILDDGVIERVLRKTIRCAEQRTPSLSPSCTTC